jgi:glutathione S-transferase
VIELYHFEPGPGSGEVLILLHEKGIDFVRRYVDVMALEHLTPEFLKLNRFGQVPVLVHDGRVLSETGFILQYLESVFHHPGFTPHDAKGRYQVNVWIKYVNEYLAPAASRLGMAKAMAAQLKGRDLAALRRTLETAPPERRQAWLKALDGFSADDIEIARGLLPVRLAHLEEALAAADWLAGPSISIADMAVFPTARLLPDLAPDLVNATATPRTLAWIERMAGRPAVKAALAEARQPNPVYAPGPEGSRWG